MEAKIGRFGSKMWSEKAGHSPEVGKSSLKHMIFESVTLSSSNTKETRSFMWLLLVLAVVRFSIHILTSLRKKPTRMMLLLSHTTTASWLRLLLQIKRTTKWWVKFWLCYTPYLVISLFVVLLLGWCYFCVCSFFLWKLCGVVLWTNNAKRSNLKTRRESHGLRASDLANQTAHITSAEGGESSVVITDAPTEICLCSTWLETGRQLHYCVYVRKGRSVLNYWSTTSAESMVSLLIWLVCVVYIFNVTTLLLR